MEAEPPGAPCRAVASRQTRPKSVARPRAPPEDNEAAAKKNLARAPGHGGWRAAAALLAAALAACLTGPVSGLDGPPPLAASQQVRFAEPEGADNTQRVAVGRSVRFKCVVHNIGDHKVAWFHKDRHILLAVDNKTVAWRERIQVSSQADSVFVLQIDSVQLADKGHYICQLNTQPARSQTHTLDVVKPPQIREQETTINIEPAREFSPVELRCVADGIPAPVIKWRRESQTFELPFPDEEPDALEEPPAGAPNSAAGAQVAPRAAGAVLALDHDAANEEPTRLAGRHSGSPPEPSGAPGQTRRRRQAVDAAGRTPMAPIERRSAPTHAPEPARPANETRPFIAEGEVLRIERVSRYDMGYYMCIASNGVPPSVSQRIFLPVSYVSPPRNTNLASAPPRPKENNASRFAADQTGADPPGGGARPRESPRAPPGRAEPNPVGSGRSYHRHRQLKAARSSVPASGAPAAAPAPGLALLGPLVAALLLGRLQRRRRPARPLRA